MANCRWPDCPVEVPPDMWGCRTHWFQLPPAIRSAIWKAFRSAGYAGLTEAHQAAQDWIAARKGGGSTPSRVVKCTAPGCGRDLIHLQTRAGKSMPCHAETVGANDALYIHGKHEPHWGSCSGESGFRRKK